MQQFFPSKQEREQNVFPPDSNDQLRRRIIYNYIIGERYSNDPFQNLRNSEISISEKFRVQSVLRPH